MRVMLDTNVLAAWILGLRSGSTSAPAQIFRLWSQDAFDIVVSEHIVLELEKTLTNCYFAARISPDELSWHLRALTTDAVQTEITATVSGIASHPEDDLVLAAAVSAQARYPVTGDDQLKKVGSYRETATVTPRAFLDNFEKATRQLESEK